MKKELPGKYLILFLVTISVVLGTIFYFFFLFKNQISPAADSITTTSNRPQFLCPVDKDICNKGEILYDSNGDYGGIGYILSPGTNILAVFSGQAEAGQTTFLKPVITYPSISLKNKLGDFEANYIFVGKNFGRIAEVKEGEILTSVESGQIGSFKNINLIISFNQIIAEKHKNLLKIKPSDLVPIK